MKLIPQNKYSLEHLKRYAYRYNVGLKETKLRIITKQLQMVKDKNVLDIGCGIGIFSNLSHEKGAQVFSVDAFKTMTNHVHQSNKSLLVINASAENLPFRNGVRDIVLVLDVIEHTCKPLQVLRETNGVLR